MFSHLPFYPELQYVPATLVAALLLVFTRLYQHGEQNNRAIYVLIASKVNAFMLVLFTPGSPSTNLTFTMTKIHQFLKKNPQILQILKSNV